MLKNKSEDTDEILNTYNFCIANNSVQSKFC